MSCCYIMISIFHYKAHNNRLLTIDTRLLEVRSCITSGFFAYLWIFRYLCVEIFKKKLQVLKKCTVVTTGDFLKLRISVIFQKKKIEHHKKMNCINLLECFCERDRKKIISIGFKFSTFKSHQFLCVYNIQT